VNSYAMKQAMEGDEMVNLGKLLQFLVLELGFGWNWPS